MLVIFKKPIVVLLIGTNITLLFTLLFAGSNFVSPLHVMSEDMVKDGYEDIINIDISSVAIEMMRRKYEQVSQLKYMQMDVRDMSYFFDESFHSVIDKGTLDSLMITYGDPTIRIPHLNLSMCNWKIELYIIPRPGFQNPAGSTSSAKSLLEPVALTDKGLPSADYVLEDPDSHFIYICKKIGELTDLKQQGFIPWIV